MPTAMDRRPLPLSFRPLWPHLSILGLFAAFGVFAYFAAFDVFAYLGFLHYLSRTLELKIGVLGWSWVSLGDCLGGSWMGLAGSWGRSLGGKDLVSTWLHLSPPNLPQMGASWFQNPSKMKHWFEMCFLMDVGPLLIDFLPQHGMAEVAKTSDSVGFL